MTTYRVTAERGSGPIWVFQSVDHPGAISEGRRLADADHLMREAIAWVASIDPDRVEIALDVRLPDDLADRAATVRRMIAELDDQQRAVAAESRALAKELAGRYSGADTARILGLSPQRISQLVNS